MTISIGIIGCGRIARAVHLPTLLRQPGVRVAALADTDPQARAEAHKIAPEARAFENYNDLLNLPEVAAVLIALPPSLHAEAAVAAFARGKHVYLEKPLAESLDSGRRILAAWRAGGTVGQIGFNYRFNPLHVEARTLIQSGAIGAVRGARSLFFSERGVRPPWLKRSAEGGSALHELGSHHFDLLPHILGQTIVSVQAGVPTSDTENDWAAVSLRFSGGAQAQCFFATGQAQDDRFEYYGTTGKLLVDRFRSLSVERRENADSVPRLRRLRETLKAVARSPLLGDDLLAPRREQSYARALADFVSQVEGRGGSGPDLRDGFHSLAAVAAAEESARTGCAVALARFLDADTAG